MSSILELSKRPPLVFYRSKTWFKKSKTQKKKKKKKKKKRRGFVLGKWLSVMLRVLRRGERSLFR